MSEGGSTAMKHVHKLGVHGLENVCNTKTMLTDKKICSKHLYGTLFEKFLRKT